MGQNDFYISPNADILEKDIFAIESCWQDFLKNLQQLYKDDEGIDIKIDYSEDILALEELVKRVHERRDYFLRYHKGMQMSEFKEIGLNMFWLMKFQIFRIDCKEIDSKIKFNINEDFALYFMFSALKKMAEKLGLSYDSDKLLGQVYNEILYSLCFRDISKEALGLIVELIANIIIKDLPYKEPE